MPMLFTNTAEGMTNGTTPSTSNTGGASGTAVQGVNVGTGNTITASNAQAHGGSLSYRFGLGTTASSFLQWSTSTGSGRTVLEFWVQIGSSATGSVVYLAALRNASSNAATLLISSAGRIGVNNSTGAGVSIPSPSPIFPANTWMHVFVAVTPGTTSSNGVFEYEIRDAADTVWHSWSSSSFNAGTTEITLARIGSVTTSTRAETLYYDDIQGFNVASGWVNLEPPTLAVTVGDYWAISAASSTPGGNGTLSYSIVQNTGTSTTPTVLAPGVWGVTRQIDELTYTVTVTESGSGLSDSGVYTVPARVSFGPLVFDGTDWV